MGSGFPRTELLAGSIPVLSTEFCHCVTRKLDWSEFCHSIVSKVRALFH